MSKAKKNAKVIESPVIHNEVPVVEAAVEPVVQTPAVVIEKKPKVNRRPYIAFVEISLETGEFSKKELLEKIMVAFPHCSKGGVNTFLTDLKNPKYRHWKDRAVTVLNEKMIFEDKIPTPEEAAIVEQAELATDGGDAERPAEAEINVEHS